MPHVQRQMQALPSFQAFTAGMDVTSADSQSLTKLGTSVPDRVPSNGPWLLYAQRENRLVMGERGCL
jgi:hypothetical protein